MLSIISKNLQNSSQAPNIVLVYGEPGLKKLKVLYSEEVPRTPAEGDRRTPASISFVPSAAGLIIAGEVIKDIANLR